MINLNVKQWRSEDQTKLDQFMSALCSCTCHRTDVEDEKYHTLCMSCICAFQEKESRQRKRKE